jgi:hypothetical protein
MGTGEIVVVQPGGKLVIAFFGVGVVADIGPLAKSGLDEGRWPRTVGSVTPLGLKAETKHTEGHPSYFDLKQ